jgi:hypothetical protein
MRPNRQETLAEAVAAQNKLGQLPLPRDKGGGCG